MNAATVIQLLRDKPHWLQMREGRDLFEVCRELVRGSTWETALFPEPLSSFERRQLQEFKDRFEQAVTAALDQKTKDLHEEGA